MKSSSTLYISKGNTDNTAKVGRDRSVPLKELRGPKDALRVFPLKYSLYVTTSRWAGSFVWDIRRVFWRRSRQSELWGGKKIYLVCFPGLRWRLYLQDTRPIPQTIDNCLIDVKNTITIKLEIRSLCALSSVQASIVPLEDWAGRRRKRAENWIFFRFLPPLNLSTMGTKGSGRWVNVWTVRQEVAIVERWPMWRGGG